MKITLLVFCIIVLICVILPYLYLLYTRNRADWIIAGKKSASTSQLDKYIWTLTASTMSGGGFQVEEDIYRIDKLCEIRNDWIRQHS